MFLKTSIGLLGDAIGTIPVIIALSKTHDGKTYLLLNTDAVNAREIYNFIPKKYDIEIHNQIGFIYDPYNEGIMPKEFNLSRAFDIAVAKNLHMIQAHFSYFGLGVPSEIVKPELEFPDLDVPQYDYILAPFSRSLPDVQKWPQDNWNKLVDMMPDKTFVVFGNEKYDKLDYVFSKPNVTHMYSKPLNEVMNVIKRVRYGVLSVVTGISHFCYPLDVPNVLFINQNMAWGKNPKAIYLEKPIHSYTAQEVSAYLKALPLRA